MKDLKITITKKRQRTELIIMLCCFVTANLLNVYAIIAYNTDWAELFSQMLWIVVLSIVLYLLISSLRLIYWMIRGLMNKKKTVKEK